MQILLREMMFRYVGDIGDLPLDRGIHSSPLVELARHPRWLHAMVTSWTSDQNCLDEVNGFK